MPRAQSRIARLLRPLLLVMLTGVTIGRCAPALAETRVTAAAGVATENVGRGISYSREKVAPFGNFTVRHGDIELGGSIVRVSGGGATYEAAIAGRYVLDAGKVRIRAQVEFTAYPGATQNIDYLEFGLTARREWKNAFLQLGLRYSPDDSGGAQYVFVDAGHTLARFSFATLSAKGRFGWRPYDDNAFAGSPDYHHWSTGLELARGPLAFDVVYHDTDLPAGRFFPSDARVVARITCQFLR